MRLLVHRHRPAEFLARAGPFLARHEAAENLLFGLAHTLDTQPDAYAAPAYLATVERAGGEVVMAAIRTPPRFLVLSRSEDLDAPNALLDDVWSLYPDLPGLLGPRAVAEGAADGWARRSAQGSLRTMAERIYELSRVEPPRPVPGRRRLATAEDRVLLLDWLKAFFVESGAGGTSADAEAVAAATLQHRLGSPDGGLVLWEDGEPACLAGYGGPTPTGIRLGPVYTPPARRGHGYASALVAELSQQLLDEGRQRCFLFTDLANPTSNRLYQRIGYRPVADVEEYQFQRP